MSRTEIVFIVSIVVIIFTLFVLPFIGIHINTGSGNQVGYVSAVENSGLIWKTKRVYIKPTLESTQEDVYCVMDEAIYAQLSEAAVNNSKIKANHFSWFTAGVASCDGEGAIISSIEVIK